MKVVVVVMLVSVLSLTTGLFASDGSGHGHGHGHGHYGYHHHDYYSGSTRGTSSGPYPFLMVVLTAGKEIAPTKASSMWLWVEPVAPEVVERSREREDAFHNALQDWALRHPLRAFVLVEENPELPAVDPWHEGAD